MPKRKTKIAEPAQSETARFSRLSRRSLLRWGLAVCGIAVIAVIVFYSTAPHPPTIDLSGVDPVVARAIRQARQRVWLLPRSGEAWGRLGMILEANSFSNEAGPCLVQAQRFSPNDPTWPYLLGAYTFREDSDRALPLLRRAAELSREGTVAPRLRLGEVLVEAGRLDEAEPQFQQVLTRNPSEPRALLGMGRLSFARGDMATCRDYLQQSLRQQPSRAAHLLLASVLFRLGEVSAAEQARKNADPLPEKEQWSDPYDARLYEFKMGLVHDVQRGYALLKARRNAETITLMQQTAREFPTSGEVWRVLGDAYKQSDDLAAAKQAFQQGLAAGGPPIAGLHASLADVYNKEGNYREAAEQLRQALSLEPGAGQVWLNLGKCYAAVADWPPATKAFQQATRLEPGNAEARSWLGQALAAQGRTAEAITQFQEAARIEPENPVPLNCLGLAYAKQGQTDESIAQYRKAVRLKPDFLEAHINLGQALAQAGQLQEAGGQFEKVLGLRPDYAEAHLNLGAVLQQTGHLTEAIGHYEKALRLKPNYAKSNPQLMSALTGARRASEAIGQFEQELRLNPDNPMAHANLAVVLQQTGQLPAAITHYKEVVRLKPDSAETRYNLGRVLQLTDQLVQAIEQYEHALRLNPDFPPVLNNLAWIRATNVDPKLRDGAEAVRLAKHACELKGQKNFGFLDTLAAAYAEAQQFPEAVTTAEEAVAQAKSAKQSAAADEIQSRLALYRTGKPFREPPRPASPTTNGH